MLDDRPLPGDLEFPIQNKSPDALVARLWGYWPKPDFECFYSKLIDRTFQGIVLRILYYLPFRGNLPAEIMKDADQALILPYALFEEGL